MGYIVKVGGKKANKEVEDALQKVLKKIKGTKDPPLPKEKKTELLKIFDKDKKPMWTIKLGETFEQEGLTNHSDHTISLNAILIFKSLAKNKKEQERLQAVLFHEFVHATGEGELDAEVLENLLYDGCGATIPCIKDTGTIYGGNVTPGAFWPPYLPPSAKPPASDLGEVHDKHYIWDPITGKVWRKRNGKKGELVKVGPWTRPKGEKLINGHYYFNGFVFDPVKLRITKYDPIEGHSWEVPASPHFLVELFSNIDRYEQSLIKKQGKRPKDKSKKDL
jgi:hypothetical protein